MNKKIIYIIILAILVITVGGVYYRSWEAQHTYQKNNTETSLALDYNFYTGTIAKTGITTYQYGTHTLTGIAIDKAQHTIKNIYALKGNTEELNAYIGKDVILTAKKIPGYPIEGGPDYLDVRAIEINQVEK
ncbi:MAG: hypothetical protein QM526_01640 [Alphaproteobacteria bacterium]|nr:hypothetical protein [Alphaproteobacteria bacterium]